MALLERVQADMVAAMKARDDTRLNALRMIKAALQKHQVDSMKPLDDASEQQILKQLVKQRTDAADMFRKGGREEQARKEEAERVLIESYMPAEASEEDIAHAIDAALAETGVTSAQTDGRGHESRAGQTRRQARGRKSAERKSEVAAAMTPPETTERRHKPFVPESMQMTEFTLRALLIGLVMTVVLGAANAYLGLRAGQTIAATYPAAVIGMAVLRVFKGSILEENIARTAGSIGESVAAGAIFTVPAFVIAKVWPSFSPADAYWKSTVLMTTGGVLGVLFCSLVRRVLVEDPELPFPESVAASEIHKAGQRRGARREVPVLEHGLRRAGLHAERARTVRHRQGFRRRRGRTGQEQAAAQHHRQPGARSGRHQHAGPGRPSARRIWAWATSSGRNWRR